MYIILINPNNKRGSNQSSNASRLIVPMHTCAILEHWWSDLCNIATCWRRKWNEQLFRSIFSMYFGVDPHIEKEVNQATGNFELWHYKPIHESSILICTTDFWIQDLYQEQRGGLAYHLPFSFQRTILRYQTILLSCICCYQFQTVMDS